ncbi:MAG: FAD-binding oxidoreductase [Rhodobacteraceae bacterium]|nr:FAD-binding oxidoreductase [Paracoccaceae bacterium]
MDILTANDRQGEYPNSYYTASAYLLFAQPHLTGETKTDICVVGGGYTGLSAALHLAQRGYDVALLEAHRVGFGASGRNGGQVGTGQRLDQDDLEKVVGLTRARALWDMSLESVALVKKLVEGHAIDCGLAPGVIHADHRRRFVRHSLAYAEKLNRDYGYDQISGLDRDAIRALVGTEDYHGGTLDLGAAHLHPLNYALGLARACLAAGVRIYENSRVTSLAGGVHTAKGRVTADQVILAGNGYLDRLNPDLDRRVMPINNYIIATEPLPEKTAKALIANNHAVADSRFVINYFRLSQDNRLLFGGTESYGYRFPAYIAAKVRKPMLRIYPELRNTRIDYAWGGTLGITMTRMPLFSRLDNRTLTASGFSGHGVAMATLAGKLLAEASAGHLERFDLMAGVPSRPFPGGAGMRAPLLAAAMFWFSLRDRL